MNAREKLEKTTPEGVTVKIEAWDVPTALIFEIGGEITAQMVERISDFVAKVARQGRKRGAISATFACSQCGKDVTVKEVTCPECTEAEKKQKRPLPTPVSCKGASVEP